MNYLEILAGIKAFLFLPYRDGERDNQKTAVSEILITWISNML